MKIIESFSSAIGSVNNWIGKGLRWVIYPLTLLVFVEVIRRYIFNSPTVWARDITLQLQGLLVALGGAYVLYLGTHVRVDVLVNRLSARKRAIVDMCTSSLFFFAVGILVWLSWKMGLNAVVMQERFTSLWQPPIYPLKIVVAIGAVLMFMQGLSSFLRSLVILKSPENKG